MVEVAGIEPASKEQVISKSTCVVVFDLDSSVEDNQTICYPAYNLRWML